MSSTETQTPKTMENISEKEAELYDRQVSENRSVDQIIPLTRHLFLTLFSPDSSLGRGRPAPSAQLPRPGVQHARVGSRGGQEPRPRRRQIAKDAGQGGLRRGRLQHQLPGTEEQGNHFI